MVRPEAEVAGEGAVDARPERGAGVVIGEQRLAEPGELRPRVARAERLAGEKLGVVRREVEADVEGLLPVGAGGRIERLVHEAGITAVAADRLDRDCLLVGERQREKAARLGEGLGDQRPLYAVIDDVEKADVATGDPDLFSQTRRSEAVLAPLRQIDDRKGAFHAKFSIVPSPRLRGEGRGEGPRQSSIVGAAPDPAP